MTLKAARLIASADVIAYHSGTEGRSIARTDRRPADPCGRGRGAAGLPGHHRPDGPPRRATTAQSTSSTTSRRSGWPSTWTGRTVVVLAEGDPLFYGSYMYLHDRLAARFPSEIVPGVTSVDRRSRRAADAAGPARGRADRAARHAAGAGAGPPARRHRRGGDHEARAAPSPAYGRRCGRPGGSPTPSTWSGRRPGAASFRSATWTRARAVLLLDRCARAGATARRRSIGRDAPALAAHPDRRPPSCCCRPRPRAGPLGHPRGGGRARRCRPRGRLRTVRRPGAATARAAAARLRQHRRAGPGPARAGSGPGGERVAVVSGGDAGVFGMASAVFEAAEDDPYAPCGSPCCRG